MSLLQHQGLTCTRKEDSLLVQRLDWGRKLDCKPTTGCYSFNNDPKALKDFYFAAPPLSKIWVPDSLGQGLVAVLAKWCMLKTMRVAQGNLSELEFFTYMDWEAHMNRQEYGAPNSDVTRENRRSMDKLKIRRFPFPQMG